MWLMSWESFCVPKFISAGAHGHKCFVFVETTDWLLLKSFANWVLNETFSNNYVLLKISKIFCKLSGTNHSSWTRQAVNRATWIEKWVTVTAEIEIDTFLRAGSRSLPLTEKLLPAAPILTLVTYV